METPKNGKLAAFFGNTEQIMTSVSKAVREAILRHKLLGQPIVIWRDGQVVWVPAEEIVVPEETPHAGNGKK